MYKLAIGNVVQVLVKLKIQDGAEIRQFVFTLTAERMSQEEFNAKMADKEALVSEILLGVGKDWSGQRLVLDGAGQPAPFSAEAFSAMLSVPGAPVAIFQAYVEAIGVKGKEKN